MKTEHKLNKDLHILLYQNEGHYFLLDLRGFLFAEIDVLTFEIFSQWNGENTDEVKENLAASFTLDEIERHFTEIQESIQAKVIMYPYPEQKRNELPVLLWFHLTDDCNMRCHYCFNHESKAQLPERKMNLDTARKAVDYFFSICKDSYTLFHYIGGEPLLNFALIKEIVPYIEKKANEQEVKTRHILTTNAIAMTEEKAEFFKKHHFSIVVSIDGDAEAQNIHRVLPEAKGSYAKVIQGIRILHNHQIPLTAKITLTEQNVNRIVELQKHLYDLGFGQVSYQFVVSSLKELVVKEDNLPILRKNLNILADNFFPELCDYKYSDRFMGWMEKIYKKPVKSGCSFINFTKIVVDPDGKYYTCEMAVGDSKFIVGDIDSGVDINKYHPYIPPMLKDRPICKECWLRRYCDGGCYYFSYVKHGDFDHPDPVVCQEIQESFLASLRIFTSLYLKDPDLLELIFTKNGLHTGGLRDEIKRRCADKA